MCGLYVDCSTVIVMIRYYSFFFSFFDDFSLQYSLLEWGVLRGSVVKCGTLTRMHRVRAALDPLGVGVSLSKTLQGPSLVLVKFKKYMKLTWILLKLAWNTIRSNNVRVNPISTVPTRWYVYLYCCCVTVSCLVHNKLSWRERNRECSHLYF